jgi:hypothetical protein
MEGEPRRSKLANPAQALFRPLAFKAVGDEGAHLVQGVENP